MEKLVSIIIPSYKNVDVLPRAINSALRQTYEHIEIIVVDDNHPDSEYRIKTIELMNTYTSNEKVKYLLNVKNSERSATRNNGARISNGDYIMFLDNDDEFLNGKVETQIECLEEKDDSYAVCYSHYYRYKNGKKRYECKEKREGNYLVDVLSRNFFNHPGSNLMIKRDVFFEVGGFNENLSINEDIDLLVRILCKYKIAYCRTPGLIVHMHKSNIDYESMTNKYIKSQNEVIKTLNATDTEKFNKMISLQLIRFYFLKDFKRLITIKRKNKIGNIILLRYVIYLLKRKATGKVYGFKL